MADLVNVRPISFPLYLEQSKMDANLVVVSSLVFCSAILTNIYMNASRPHCKCVLYMFSVIDPFEMV